MEPSGEPSQINKDNFLEVPNLSDSLSEDEEVKATFKPGFSPQPSRRGSDSSEDTYLDIPSSGTRRVSFADTFGLNLVSVKEFDCWDLPSVLINSDLRKDIFHPGEYVLSPLFDLPSSKELMQQLQEQKAILESAEYLPGSTSMKGIIRVLNISFEKLVYVRMSLDDWQTHYDILAEYVPNSCDGETDQFSFKISLVPPYQKDGSKVQFCIRYETSVGTFWSNNNGTNYILVCQKKEQELKPVKPCEDLANRQIKGCLKVKSSKEESSVTTYKNNFENSKITDTYIPTIVCSHEEKEDLEIGNQNIKDVNREHDELNEKEFKLMVSQHLTRSPASKDEKNTFSTDTVNFPNKAEGFENEHIYDEIYTDFLKKTLSSSSSPGSNLKRDFYHDEIFFSGNDCSHQPSEKITSDMRKINLPLRNISSDELVKSQISIKEVLDDKANPDKKRGKVQISCSSSDQLMSDKLNKKHEVEAMKIKVKDWECLRRDLPSDFHLEESIEKACSTKDHGTCINEKEKHLGIDEKQSENLQSVLHNKEKKMSHSKMNAKRIGASSRELTVLPSEDNTTSDQAIWTDLFQSPTGNLSWEEAVVTTPECDPLPSKGTTLGEMPGQVCSKNRSVLRNYHLYQAEEETSYWANTEDQNKKKQHKQIQNVLEGQEKATKSKTNTIEQIKEQADCEDMWGKRDNTESLNATPTELFTCQKIVSCGLSSLASHDINEKVGAGTAYIIKTSESALENMSATEKAIIAKIPQKTAQSYRPIEVKETMFDPHEGRKDNSHHTICQGDKVGVIYDNDFEKITCLDICNVHVDEVESEEMIPIYDPPKKCGIGNITSAEESLQVISGNQRADLKLNFHLGLLPTNKKVFPKNTGHQQVQELSKEMDVAAIINPALNSDPDRLLENGSHISNHHAKTSVSSYEQAVTIENTVTTMTLQSIPSKSEYNCNPSGMIQGIEKQLHSWDISEEVSKSSGIMTVSRNEKSIGQISQQEECNVKTYLRPMASITEDMGNIEDARHKNEGLLNSGQSLCFSSDKESKSSGSADLHAQECQAQSSGSLLLKYINSNISHFLLFLVFLVTIYQYDLMISLAFYLFLLYCLSWEGGRQKKSVRKK
ncbi:protein phosphatase 1 regulatory subunit 3A [Sturnira hondurensis]|uniref:protein phosphatase 1 regulatory subunit 3A n=1 Tax=Sturnira hondurensis TaxID=192404 RepID=UPI00187AA050|nr:protein phosphatase 1 regulatory subunit 3A [Sturnira hondurensis]